MGITYRIRSFIGVAPGERILISSEEIEGGIEDARRHGLRDHSLSGRVPDVIEIVDTTGQVVELWQRSGGSWGRALVSE